MSCPVMSSDLCMFIYIYTCMYIYIYVATHWGQPHIQPKWGYQRNRQEQGIELQCNQHYDMGLSENTPNYGRSNEEN